jgi:hypothetical protein
MENSENKSLLLVQVPKKLILLHKISVIYVHSNTVFSWKGREQTVYLYLPI